MKRVLIVGAHRPHRAPNQRYRIEQYLPYLEANGFACTLSHLITKEEDKFFYQPGHYLAKAKAVFRHMGVRRRDLKRVKDYDLVMVVREALLSGSTFFERGVKQTGVPMIFDFDDAIWIQNISAANRFFKFMKNPAKTSDIIGWSSLIFAGNEYLADYARRFNPHTVVIPTTVDTDLHKPDGSTKPADAPVVLGWSGSHTTLAHFRLLEPVLLQLKEKYGDRIAFTVMGAPGYRHEQLGIEALPWTEATEVPVLNTFDIGLMPLPNDQWAQGKCGLKALAAMAVEKPVVLSPVGVNTTIVQDGVNGLWADTPEQWLQQLSRLIEDAELRRTLGTAARQTVVEHYSVLSQRDRYLQYFRQLTDK